MIMSSHRHGFTLIELLIVVAIIAILAAIAVPNFLEAQVRAKVSRSKADIRSLATALESYRVDNNSYPPTIFGSQVPFPHNDTITTVEDRWVIVTSPIAYITSVPDDPFGGRVATSILAPPWEYKTYDFVGKDKAPPPNHDPFFDVVEANLGKAGEWYVASQGPDEAAGIIQGQTGMAYNPTNGTVSDGDIIRLGPGGMEL